MKTPFTNNYPGHKWVKGFFDRHPIFSVKKSEYLSRQRALLTEHAVCKWFKDVRQQLTDENIDFAILEDGRRVFNLDESALYTNPSGKLTSSSTISFVNKCR